MGDPFERSKLSRTSWISLAVLLVANLALFSFYPRAARTELAPAPVVATASDLKLVEELDPATRAKMANPVQQPTPRPLPVQQEQVQSQPPAPRLSCQSWGPFTNQIALGEIRKKLTDVAQSVEVRQQQVSSAPDYLVFLNSDNNLDNARRLLKELESQQFDVYVIAGGEYVNAVSAGVFSDRSRADLQAKKLEDLGYDPRLESLERVQLVEYLIAQVPADYVIEGFEQQACEEIASAG